MRLENAIQTASKMAADEDADMVVGKIEGAWQIAHVEDEGRKKKMGGDRFLIHGWGMEPEEVTDYLILIELGE